MTLRKPAAVGYSTITRELREACRIAVEAGNLREPFTLHAMRHYYVSLLLSSGVSEQQCSEWAGHSSTKLVREVYGTAREPGNLSAASDEVGAMIEGHLQDTPDLMKDALAVIREQNKRTAAKRSRKNL